MRVKYRKGVKITLGLAMLVVLVYLISSFKGSKRDDYRIESRPDGEQIVFYNFNKNNQKTLELRCTEFNKTGKRTNMKNIAGLIYKKGRMNKDIKIFGDRGYEEDEQNTFFVEENARIISDDFTIKSKSFLLKGKSHLVTPHPVEYTTKGLNGLAETGMEMFLKKNIINFSNTHGQYSRDKRTFEYSTDLLWVFDETKSVIMEKNSMLRDKQSLLRSDWITIKFDNDFKQVVESSAQKNSYLYIEEPDKKQVREVKAEHIGSIYNDQGKLTRLVVMKKGEILLKDNDNHIIIASELVDLYFDPASGRATEMNIPMTGRVENTGKTKFEVSADKINAKFNKDGEIRICDGQGHTRYVVEDYHGVSDQIIYDVDRDTITVSGENCEMETKQNTFRSTQFKVKVTDKILSSQSDKGAQSIITLEKQSVLLSADPVYINAQEFVIYEKENRLNYENHVILNQGNTVMRSNRLQITDENKISVTGAVTLTFQSEGKDVELKAEEVTFNPTQRTITMSGNAAIKNSENILQATSITIFFNDKNEVARITGEDRVNFNREDLSGTADQVNWLFKEEEMILSGSPRIDKSGGGSTTGKELKIHLKTGDITILSGDRGRTETIIRQ